MERLKNDLLASRDGLDGLNVSESDKKAADNAEKAATEVSILSEQVATMREALGSIDNCIQLSNADMGGNHHYRLRFGYINNVVTKIRDAIALARTAAEEKARANAEKAALLDWYEKKVTADGEFPWVRVHKNLSICGANPGAKDAFPTLVKALRDMKAKMGD
jgi:hypothetical protein